MIAKLHIPYGFGDCVNGFKYEGGDITDIEYAKRMINDYNQHKIGVDEMMSTSFTHNIARNNYTKEKNKYKQQKQIFGEIKCYVDDKDFNDMKLEELLDYFEQNKNFVMIVRIFNKKEMTENPDVETDLKSWQRECVRIDRLNIDTVSKFKSLSKKDLKLTFGDDIKMAAILKDCRMVNVYSNMKFAIWVDKIIFIKEKK